MKIASLDIFNTKDQIAWIGGGGKTSLIFAIAKELFSTKCFITTTTKMGLSEKKFADHVYAFDEESTMNISSMHGTNFFYKNIHPIETNKVVGLDPDHLKVIAEKIRSENAPLLIEADGSKQKPIKMHADHEPVIPEFVNKVCIVVGLSAIGKKLYQEDFHRPELISEFLNIPLGSQFSWDHLFQLLTDENGYLKKIPENVEKILFLHQADECDDQTEINKLALRLKNHYADILLSSISEDSLIIHAHWGAISCSIIAAGASTRFGSPKQLALYNHKTFIENVIETALRIYFSEITVVLGANYELILPIVEPYPIQVIINKQWDKGQSTSVRESVVELTKRKINGIIFLMVDQPQISVELIENVIHKFAYEKNAVIVHSFNNQNRHPILFSKSTFDDLLRIGGEKGGRQLFDKYPPGKIQILDPFFALDVDRVEDLDKLKRME